MLKITTEKNILISPAAGKKIDSKINSLEKIVSSFGLPNELRIRLQKTNYFDSEGRAFRCEINVRLPGKVLRSESEKNDIVAAVTEAKNKMSRLIKQHKEKTLDH